MMKVDVIIPAHNPGPYLRDALNSVMAQTYRDWHIYVIDDASDGDMSRLVNRYKKTTYIRLDENGGPGHARNYGIAQGDGRLISFLDADDIWEPRKLEYSVREFQRNPDIGMTCGNYQRLVDRDRLCFPFYRRPPIINWRSLMRINYVACGSVTVRRNVFEDVGGFNENYWIAEDADLWLRISEKYSIKYIHKVLYHYSCINDGSSLTHRPEILNQADINNEISRKSSMERLQWLKEKIVSEKDMEIYKSYL